MTTRAEFLQDIRREMAKTRGLFAHLHQLPGDCADGGRAFDGGHHMIKELRCHLNIKVQRHQISAARSAYALVLTGSKPNVFVIS